MQKTVKTLIAEVQKKRPVFAPQEIAGGLVIAKLKNPDNFIVRPQHPLFSFKKFFVPAKETLLFYNHNRQKMPRPGKKIALAGLGLQDLKYVLLYDLVFQNDPLYQQRRKSIFLIAHNQTPGPESNFAHMEFSENALKEFPYDIFLILEKGDVRFAAGSLAGKKILRKINQPFADFSRHQVFRPAVLPEIPQKIQQKMLAAENLPIWEELNKKCLRCGKCSVVCPTCFCFRLDDQPALNGQAGNRQRCWDSCFFDEFHEVTGGHDFQPAIKNRIHFWYYHKFARIPKEFNLTGCVGCKRCHLVCPADIDIQKVLEAVMK